MDYLKFFAGAEHQLAIDGRLELVAVRTASRLSNAFDDWLIATRITGTEPLRRENITWPCTTDPGTYWLRQPMRVAGTAALAPGRYEFKLGSHKGAYPCLVQSGPVRVYRDANRDDVLDLDPNRVFEGDTWSIQVHRANARHKSTVVEKWSAGCVVLPDPDDYDEMLALVIDYLDTRGMFEDPVIYLHVVEES